MPDGVGGLRYGIPAVPDAEAGAFDADVLTCRFEKLLGALNVFGVPNDSRVCDVPLAPKLKGTACPLKPCLEVGRDMFGRD